MVGYTRQFNEAVEGPSDRLRSIDLGATGLSAQRSFDTLFSTSPTASTQANATVSHDASLMAKLSTQSFAPPAGSIDNLSRDVTNATPDLGAIQHQAGALKQDAQNTMAALKETHEVAQRQMMGALIEAGKGQNPPISAAQTIKSFAPTSGATHMSAGVTMAVDLATGGGGSFVTWGMQAFSVTQEAYDQAKGLSPGKKAELADEALAKLSASRPEPGHALALQAPQQPISSELNWDNLSGQDGVALMETNFENLPETQRLQAYIDGVEGVELNHTQVADREHVNEGNKLETELAQGDLDTALVMAGHDLEDVQAISEDMGLNAAEVDMWSSALNDAHLKTQQTMALNPTALASLKTPAPEHSLEFPSQEASFGMNTAA